MLAAVARLGAQPEGRVGNANDLRLERWVRAAEYLVDSVHGLELQEDQTLEENLKLLERELDSLSEELDSVKAQARFDRGPAGLFDDLMQSNQQINAPSAVVLFPYNEYTLTPQAYRQLKAFVTLLIAQDDTDEYYIIASVDDPSASQRRSKKLYRRRCEAVYKALVKEFGVEKRHLLILGDVGLMQFAPQQNSQKVLLIQRTSETEEVLGRWK